MYAGSTFLKAPNVLQEDAASIRGIRKFHPWRVTLCPKLRQQAIVQLMVRMGAPVDALVRLLEERGCAGEAYDAAQGELGRISRIAPCKHSRGQSGRSGCTSGVHPAEWRRKRRQRAGGRRHDCRQRGRHKLLQKQGKAASRGRRGG